MSAGAARAAVPALELTAASVRRQGRSLFTDLDLSVAAGEFVAVLGPNGAGKSSLLQVLLGLLPLSAGRARVGGRPVHQGRRAVGYVPQRAGFPAGTGLRVRDVVRLGLDGHRCVAARRAGTRVNAALAAVGAADLARRPVHRLSGGEQQRVRIAQAVASEPVALLCDEPLSSLDLRRQREVLTVIDDWRTGSGAAVLMVTHEINPVLPYVDRVLYLVDGRWALGRPDEVLTGPRLSALYGSPVEVLRHRGRYLVVGDSGRALA